MIRITRVLFLIFLVGMVARPADARPPFLDLFRGDALRNQEVDGCGTCHVNPQGGGRRNDFGLAFAASEFTITPVLRSGFPDHFNFTTAEVPTGGMLYFSGTADEGIVFEQDGEKHLVDIPAIVGNMLIERPPDPPPPPPMHAVANFSFFITSEGPGNGGNLGGLAGADRHCQQLADAVDAGHKTWRAYLSTSFEGDPIVNAGDRIGSGPWFNSKGVMVARGVADLHRTESRLNKETALDENGAIVNGRGDDPNRHDILTGSLMDGTSAVDMNCSNWTSSGEERATVGHFDRQGGGDNPTSWNQAHASRSCSQEDLRATGGDGLFFCFAID